MEYVYKDFELPILSGTHFSVYVESGGTDCLVYEGDVGNEGDVIYPNRIAARYLREGTPAFADATMVRHPEECRRFKFYGTSLIADYLFLYAWCGEFENNLINSPINGHLDPRMVFFLTAAGDNDFNMEVEDV